MATLLRSRRFADRATEPTQQYITFQLRQYRFALPIQHLKRVSLVKGETDPIANLTAAGTESEEVRWIDVDRCIFGAAIAPVGKTSEPTNPQKESCVILLSDGVGHTVGLAIDTQPKMQRIAQSQIAPLLEDKAHPMNLQGVCESTIRVDGERAIFLLDLGKLCDL
jgi:chemotaxis signal transduction protein